MAIYANETWKSTATITRRLNVFQQHGLRQILKISYRDHVTKEEVLQRTASQQLADVALERRFRFAITFFANIQNDYRR